MTQETSTQQVTACAQAVLSRRRILANPYLIALADETMSLEEFRRTQEQFFFAVEFYPRPMAALVGRIKDPVARLEILRNVVEEHGEFKREAFHRTTFLKFLELLGCDVARVTGLALWPEVRAFNSVITAACTLDEIEVGICCLGIIELAFAGISAAIGTSVVRHGWIPGEKLVHYSLHAELDVRHAADFFEAIGPSWDAPARRYYVEQGLELGAYVFDRLYRDLLAAVRADLPNDA